MVLDNNVYEERPTIISIYGISGCGKSHFLDQLTNPDRVISLNLNNLVIKDGSAHIDKNTAGGINAFKKLPTPEQNYIRESVIEEIYNECREEERSYCRASDIAGE